MRVPSSSDPVDLQKEPGSCPECGSASRVGRSLCLSCMLSAGVGGGNTVAAGALPAGAGTGRRAPDRRPERRHDAGGGADRLARHRLRACVDLRRLGRRRR